MATKSYREVRPGVLEEIDGDGDVVETTPHRRRTVSLKDAKPILAGPTKAEMARAKAVIQASRQKDLETSFKGLGMTDAEAKIAAETPRPIRQV